MKKVRSNKGFTLVEMLACTVTLLMVCLICTTGMNLALKSYEQSIFESDSQMLESTLNLYVGDMLRYATRVTIDEESADNIVEGFTNAAYQVYDGNYYVGTNGYLYCTVNDNSSGALVIGKGNYAETLCIKGFELHYDEATGIFTGKYTIGSTLSDTLSKECTFTYRTIAD